MILPGGVSYAEVGGASAVSKVCIVEVGRASNHPEAWLLLWEDGVSIHPVHRESHESLTIDLGMLSHHGNSLCLLSMGLYVVLVNSVDVEGTHVDLFECFLVGNIFHP